MATITELTEDDVRQAAEAINVEYAALRAVIEIEAAGSGFIADGRPTILYEAHVFHRLTGGRYVSSRDRHGVALSVAIWNKSLYGAGGAHQWERLEDAAKLDWDAAHQACSWGAGQILGTNHVTAGHPTITGFVEAMKSGAPAQLDAMVAFLKSNRLDVPLRAKNWAAFAKGYNGPGYAQNAYDTKLAAAYRKWSSASPTTPSSPQRPTLRKGSTGQAVRELQEALDVSWLVPDGSFGDATDFTVRAFQATKRLAVDGVVGPSTWDALG
jgi:N-acetylmuramidase/Putative peptidoglycan binding domain